MQTLSLREIRAMDVLFLADEECGRVLMDSVLPEVLLARNVRKLDRLARKLGLPLEKFCLYVWFQTYIRELSRTCSPLPSTDVVAQQLGIDPHEFDNYVQSAAIRYDDLVALEPPENEILAPWEHEDDLLEDLQNDAAMRGD